MKIQGIIDHGASVIVMTLKDEEETKHVYWDRRMYGHFLESEAAEQGIEAGGTVDLNGEWETDGETVWRVE